jgi:hypothetical protein
MNLIVMDGNKVTCWYISWAGPISFIRTASWLTNYSISFYNAKAFWLIIPHRNAFHFKLLSRLYCSTQFRHITMLSVRSFLKENLKNFNFFDTCIIAYISAIMFYLL